MNRDRNKPTVAQRDLDNKISSDPKPNISDEQVLFIKGKTVTRNCLLLCGATWLD